MLKKINCLICICLFLFGVAKAATVTDLYQVQVPVANKSEALRQQSIQSALQQVLVKVSGHSAIVENDKVKAALSQGNQYLQQYSYQNSSKGLLLDLTFSHAMIKNLLNSAGQAVWGVNRPLLLIWFVENTASGLQVLSDASSPVINTILQLVQMRALPVIFPLMDITDLQSVSAKTLFSGDTQAIIKASARYVPDAILLVRVDALDPKALTSTWTLYANNQTSKWQISGDAMQTVLQTGVDDVTDTLASLYAVVNTGKQAQAAMLQVTGLQGVASYVKLRKYLQHLNAVNNISIISLSQNGAVFSLTLNGSIKMLTQEISLGRLLLPLQSKQQSASETLTYQFRG